MNITLTPELEQLVQTKVARGEVRSQIEAAEPEIDRRDYIERAAAGVRA